MTIGDSEDDRVHLDRLEIENFKSYKGHVVVGPLRPFTAVIGPNGSGKSNFMDAISFVFGEQARSLRVKKLNELIHGTHVNNQTGVPITKCSVTAVLKLRNGEEQKFQRLVKVSGNDATSEYRIDGKSVSGKQYVETLEGHNIVIKPRNFLVFQGQVETIATMNPKQRTALLEKISGSGELKDEYERLEKEYDESQDAVRKAFNNKKETAVEEKEAKEEKKVADEYEKRMKELDREKSLLQQFELYHKEREMDDIKREVLRQKDAVKQLETERKTAETSLKAAKARVAEKTTQLTTLDQQIRDAEAAVTKAKPEHISAKTKITHLESKKSAEERMLRTFEETQQKLSDEIKQLTADKTGIEDSKRDFEQESSGSQESQNLTQLTPEQLAEYHRLKQEASRQLKDRNQEMEKLDRENKINHQDVASRQQKYDECVNELKQLIKQRELNEARVQKMVNHISKAEEDKNKLEAKLAELRKETNDINPRMEEIKQRLGEIAERFAECRVDERDIARKAKKEELINKLRQLYPDDIFGRLIDVCHHSNKDYQLAVTKILGKSMNAIIVSTKQIATLCINYMKQQEIEPETFLPLDNLEVKPISDHLRGLDPDNVKLLLDVIQITHPDKSSIMKALKFTCGSSVTCKDTNKARELAYGNQRLQVVTWSGTLFDRNGIISGGAAELRSKAKRWDEKEVTNLRVEQAKLTEDLRELMKSRRKEEDIKQIEAQIKGLDSRKKYADKDRTEAEKVVKDLDERIGNLKAKEKELEEKLSIAQKKLVASEKKKKDLQSILNTLEDDLFRDFCVDIGVRNIRQYEAREESERQQREKRLLEFEKQINKLTQRLTYEREKKKQAEDKVEKCRETVEKVRKDLETAKEEEKEKEKKVTELEAKATVLKEKRDKLKEECDERESEAEELKKQFNAAAKSLTVTSRQIAGEETKREQLRLDRRAILQYCKMNNIELPFERGSMEDVNVAIMSGTQDTSGETSQSQESINVADDRDTNIKLDYSKLPERLKRQMDLATHRKEVEALQNRVRDLEGIVDKLIVPKANTNEKLGDIRTKGRQIGHELELARERSNDLNAQFAKVKTERTKRFTECLDTIANSIDTIYKELVNEDSAQAFLNADNLESPFNGGIIFSLVVPGKNFRPIDSLSGGEKTLASLSLLFAIHAAHPSPFFIMDEVDAALDNTNILRVAQFMRKKSKEDFQIIIISLKEEMYHHADALVGIYSEPFDVCVSKNLTLDLTQYDPRTRGEKAKK